MKFTGKVQCWEYWRCGQDQIRQCPAYPHYGRLCWPVAGTQSPQGPRTDRAKRICGCESCDFFQTVLFDGIDRDESEE